MSLYGTKKKKVSLSLRERGLKSASCRNIGAACKSLSLRERGLKSKEAIGDEKEKRSLSLRERGLKFPYK